MGDLEQRLQFAMVAYSGGARHDISSDFVSQALGAVVGIELEWLSVHCYRLEDFLVVFASQEFRNRAGAPAGPAVGVQPISSHGCGKLWRRRDACGFKLTF